MFQSSRHLTIGGVALSLVAGVLAVGAPAAAAPGPGPDDDAYSAVVGGTTVTSSTPIVTEAQLTAFEQSATPKEIVIDSVTGDVVSVAETSGAAQHMGLTNGCASSALCWVSGKVPYANFGFSSVGTYTGAWGWRGTIKSNGWSGRATYTINSSGASTTTPLFGHNSTIKFSDTSKNNITGLKIVVEK